MPDNPLTPHPDITEHSNMNGKLKALALVFALFAASGLYSIVAQKPLSPAVTLTTYQGEKLALENLRGQVVFVNFWATDCPTCVKEMPALVATHQKYQAQGYATVAIAMAHDKPDFIEAYVRQNKLPFVVAHDADGKAAAAFGGIRLTPTSFVIDRRGNIVKRILGEPDFPKLQKQIETLLLNPPQH
jgi:peroxiredoxin